MVKADAKTGLRPPAFGASRGGASGRKQGGGGGKGAMVDREGDVSWLSDGKGGRRAMRRAAKTQAA